MSNPSLKHCLIFLPLCACVSAHAQVGTPRYKFKNRSQVEAATRKHKMNVRESYNIIMCAKRQGLLKSVVRVYEQEAGKNPLNTPPQIASSFAFAHEMMSYPVRWDWKWDQTPNITKLGDADGIRMTLYRDLALQALPKSPEVLLEYAVWAKAQGQSAKSLTLLQKASNYAPKWADLQWWYAEILDSRLSSFNAEQHEKQRTRYGMLQLRALDNAERLDSAFRIENSINRASAYYDAKQYNQALAQYDTYIGVRPDYREYLGEERYLQTRNAYLSAIRSSKNN